MPGPETETLEDVLKGVPEEVRKHLEPIASQLLAMKRKRETILATARKQRNIIRKLNTRLAECLSKADALDGHAVLLNEHRAYKNMADLYHTMLEKEKDDDAGARDDAASVTKSLTARDDGTEP